MQVCVVKHDAVHQRACSLCVLKFDADCCVFLLVLSAVIIHSHCVHLFLSGQNPHALCT